MTSERSYGQYCGLARALDLVGDRWAALVVRELALGPLRFTDVLAGLPGVSTSVLASRLRRLERGGVVRRRVLPVPAASSVYELTDYGRDLVPVLLALGGWGARSLGARTPDQALRSHWLVLALKALFNPVAADGLELVSEVRLRDGPFRVAVGEGRIDVARGSDPGAQLVFEADDDALVGLLAGALDLEVARASGAVGLVAGEPADLECFLGLFRLAEPVAV